MKEKNFIDYENLGISNNSFKDELEDAAKRVINSGWYVLCDEVKQFEKEFAEYLGVKYCIGVASGLDALILSIEALSHINRKTTSSKSLETCLLLKLLMYF